MLHLISLTPRDEATIRWNSKETKDVAVEALWDAQGTNLVEYRKRFHGSRSIIRLDASTFAQGLHCVRPSGMYEITRFDIMAHYCSINFLGNTSGDSSSELLVTGLY